MNDTQPDPLSDIEREYRARRIVEGTHHRFHNDPTVEKANALVDAVVNWRVISRQAERLRVEDASDQSMFLTQLVIESGGQIEIPGIGWDARSGTAAVTLEQLTDPSSVRATISGVTRG